jgi:hypothetical protein
MPTTVNQDPNIKTTIAITYDKGETDDGYQNLCNTGSCNPNDTFTLSN